jgi:hypothetical protein
MEAVHPADTGVVTVPSAHDVASTVERLKALLAQKGMDRTLSFNDGRGAKGSGLVRTLPWYGG